MSVAWSNACVLASLLSQAFAVHDPTQNGSALGDAAGGDLMQGFDVEDPLYPSFLAGCKSGNFTAKGSQKCIGIQGLQCHKNGGCIGMLQGKPYKINCNQKQECVTDSWGGALVRKYLSTTIMDGHMHWNNGCSWICEDWFNPLGAIKSAAGAIGGAVVGGIGAAVGTVAGAAHGILKGVANSIGNVNAVCAEFVANSQTQKKCIVADDPPTKCKFWNDDASTECVNCKPEPASPGTCRVPYSYEIMADSTVNGMSTGASAGTMVSDGINNIGGTSQDYIKRAIGSCSVTSPLTEEQCRSLATTMTKYSVVFTPTCTDPSCAPGGCYQYNGDGPDIGKFYYSAAAKNGDCSAERNCICTGCTDLSAAECSQAPTICEATGSNLALMTKGGYCQPRAGASLIAA